MRISQLFESDSYTNPENILVIFPGRFQPFHKGHLQTYNHLISKFGRDAVYITTSNKVELPKSPLGFTQKCSLMNMMGIHSDRIIQTENPYRAKEVTSQINPNSTIMILAISAKDLDGDNPSLKVGGHKKDGSDNYYQPIPSSLDQCSPLTQYAYVMKVPTYQFELDGKEITDATDIREMLENNDESSKKRILLELYGNNWQEAYNILCHKHVSESAGSYPKNTKWEKYDVPKHQSPESLKLRMYGQGAYTTGGYTSLEDLEIQPDDSSDTRLLKSQIYAQAMSSIAHPLNPEYVKPGDRTWENYYSKIEKRDKESAERVSRSWEQRFPDMFKEESNTMTQPSHYIKETIPEIMEALKKYVEAMKNVTPDNINDMLEAAYLMNRTSSMIVKYTEDLYDRLDMEHPINESKTKHLESMFNDLMEDHSAKNISLAVNDMKMVIENSYGGVNSIDNVKYAANTIAESVHGTLGVSVETAAEILIQRYSKRYGISEDASAGASCAGAIASVATPFASAISRTRVGGIGTKKPKSGKKKNSK